MTNGTKQTGRRVLRATALGSALALASAGTALAAFAGASAPKQTDTVTSGVAPVKVECPAATSKDCTGKLTLKTSKPVKQGSHKSNVALGHASFSIKPGKTATVKVTLNAEGKKLLKAGKVSPLAVVASRDGSGAKRTHSTKITLKSGSQGNPAPSPLY